MATRIIGGDGSSGKLSGGAALNARKGKAKGELLHVDWVDARAVLTPRETGTEEITVVGDQQVRSDITTITHSDYQINIIARRGNTEPISFSSTDVTKATVNSTTGKVTQVGTGPVGIVVTSAANTQTISLVMSEDARTASQIVGGVEGSLRNHVTTVMADLLTAAQGTGATTAMRLYSSDLNVRPFVLNSSCWITGVDFSCASPFNSAGANQFAGTLISPRHILMVSHWYMANLGTPPTVWFIAPDGTPCQRLLMNTKNLSELIGYIPGGYYPDLVVGVLESDVDAGISFAKVLPADVEDYLPLGGVGLPYIHVDQEQKAMCYEVVDLAKEVGSAFPGGHYSEHRYPNNTARARLAEGLINGDSGHPSFLLINGELVLITCTTFAAGGGTSIAANHTGLNQLMTDLGGGYQLTDVDLSEFSTFP